MSSLESRIQKVEDRLALQDLIHSYCIHIDEAKSVDAIVDCFVDDAVLDLSGLGLPVITGRNDIHEFFVSVLAATECNAHYSTNFRINRLEGDEAECQSYVYAVGVAKDGSDILVYAKHQYHCLRTNKGWKIKHFSEPYLMPPTKDIPSFE
ncbi:nuclear transport factor 2 family protein [Pseudomonas sp. MYb185]|uniref:nuclear transport factor 2 family protein n=1 Tax=Pseudomonas sp. MYb185 TaxID=1848729 RepID=UPI000CFC7990|nr:nuclear transport factor 2 family protein [Pseudomonas sp. MYb185]PRB84140.1 ketosteroid isomerase [Pseudomonas sp. MYb185]